MWAMDGSLDEQPNRDWRATALWWRRIAAALLVTVGLLIAFIARHKLEVPVDERLLGTWQSDRSRTMEEIQRTRKLDDEQMAHLHELFGKMKVTYSKTMIVTELDDWSMTYDYEVLGRDEHSTAIRAISAETPPIDFSEFSVIHFESPDAYWLYTQLGGFREYFRRVE